MTTATIHKPIYGTGATVAYTGTAGTSALLPVGATAIYAFCTTIAHIRIGVDPTAVTSDLPLAANVPVVIPINQGDPSEAQKISAVQNASGGNLHYIPLAY